jgi:hypothetical protein
VYEDEIQAVEELPHVDLQMAVEHQIHLKPRIQEQQELQTQQRGQQVRPGP